MFHSILSWVNSWLEDRSLRTAGSGEWVRIFCLSELLLFFLKGTCLSFIQQVHIGYLLCSRHWGCNVNKTKINFCSHGAYTHSWFLFYLTSYLKVYNHTSVRFPGNSQGAGILIQRYLLTRGVDLPKAD